MVIQIVKLEKSKQKNKRLCAVFNNGQKINFGDINGHTYIDHGNKKLRDNYIKRHLGNKTEYHNVLNLIPSASVCSLYLCWGPFTDINKNVNYLNKLLMN